MRSFPDSIERFCHKNVAAAIRYLTIDKKDEWKK